MSDILTELTSLAVARFRERESVDSAARDWVGEFLSSDPVLYEAQLFSFLPPTDDPRETKLLELLFSDPEFSSFAPREGELDPMMLDPTGGARMTPSFLIKSLFSSALLQMFYLRKPNDEAKPSAVLN